MSGKVIVVGGGISGLAAAWRLERLGHEVTVLESRQEPGGRVRTEVIGEYLVDTGPDAATAGYKNWLQLVEDLGLSDQLAPTSPVLGAIRDGRIIDIDPSKPVRAAMTPAISWPAKARMVIGLARLWPRLRKVDSYQLNLSADLDEPHVNANEFARRYFGAEVAEYVIDGAMRLVAGSGSRETSQLGVLGALTGWSVPTVNIRGGLQRVPNAIAQRLADVRLGAEVNAVAQVDEGVQVTYRDETGAEHRLDADACVIATMFHTARTIWPQIDELAPDFGPRLRDVKLISISLGYARRPANECYIVTVPTVEYPDVLLMFMQHNKAPDRAPEGHSLITLYTDTLATPRYLEWADEEIIDWAAGIVEGLLPELAGQRVMGDVTRWPKAGYLADPGFWVRSRDLLDALPSDSPIVLAGDVFGAGSMEASARWGERAAQRISSRLRTGTGPARSATPRVVDRSRSAP